MIDVAIISDGRFDYMRECLESFRDMVIYPADTRIFVVEDRPSEEATAFWRDATNHQVFTHPSNMGFAASIYTAFSNARFGAHLFHLEGDFVFNKQIDLFFNEKIDLGYLERILEDAHKHGIDLLQIRFKRQPWIQDEIDAGDMLTPTASHHKQAMIFGAPILLQRDIFSTNPSLHHRKALRPELLVPKDCEINYTRSLLKEYPNAWFGIYGTLTDPPRVTHIGKERKGVMY